MNNLKHKHSKNRKINSGTISAKLLDFYFKKKVIIFIEDI